ncbi:MAG TPA: phosphoribosyl-ATP diphosphatase, partial [Pirellulales bacterium]|nr:phosphoribosyl-ATP diphosphatase [Pirellulales bacterium]
EDRKAHPSEQSYTSTLLAGGPAKIRKKLVEEAAELFEAAGEPGEAGREHVIRESADLVYHLFVLLAHRGVTLADVETELARRFGTSGLEEKGKREHGKGETQ